MTMQSLAHITEKLLAELAAKRNAHVLERHRRMITVELAPTVKEWLAKFSLRYDRPYDLPRVMGTAPPADCVDIEVAMAMGYSHAAAICERNMELLRKAIAYEVAMRDQGHWSYCAARHMHLTTMLSAETAVQIYAQRMQVITSRPTGVDAANDSLEVFA